MKTREAGNIPCVLLQSPPPLAEMALRALSISSSYLFNDHADVTHAAVTNEAYWIGPRITYVDHAVIRAYFRQYDINEAPLPADKTVRVAEFRMQALPCDLECKLSALPAGYERRLFGHDVFLIEIASDWVIDSMHDIYATV